MRDDQVLKDFLAYLEGMPQIFAAIVYDIKGNANSFESLDGENYTISGELHQNISKFIVQTVSQLKKNIRKIKLFFDGKQCNIYLFPKYSVVILFDGKDELNLLDSLLEEYHDLINE